jgi:predicted PurR-regulated permease PerM
MGVILSQVNHLREIAEPVPASQQAAEEADILQTSIKAGTIAQIVVAVIAIIGLIYLLKLVLVTTLGCMLVAYVLAPLVSGLGRVGIPRWIGALIAVLLALILVAGLIYFSFSRAVEFADQLPEYSVKLRDTVGRIRSRADQLENRARSIVDGPKTGKEPVSVKVKQSEGLSRLISENGGTIEDVLLALGFAPFLVYFMLTSMNHFHVATVRLFPKEHRLLAHRTVARISAMIRSYIVANALVGLLNTAILTLVFWFLGMRYFYFIGAISGFVSLIPYLGVFLALLPPLAGDIGALDKTGIGIVFVAVVGLHVVTMNLMYPKFIGQRLNLNPLAVSLSLLFWAWIWGAPGLILAIPILGAAKIICDHIDPLRDVGSWLGGTLNS